MTPQEQVAAKIAALKNPEAGQQISTTGAAASEAAAKDEQMAALQAALAAAQQQIADMQAAQQRTGSMPVLTGKGKLKAYYCTMPMCNIHVMRGPGIAEQLQFVAGMLETDDLQVQAHLDAICDKPGSQITSIPQTAVSLEEARMRKDIRDSAIVARDKMIAAGEKVA